MIAGLALRVAFVAGIVAFLAGGGWWARGVKAERDIAQLTERWTAESHKAIQAAYAETERRLAAQKEITDAANLRARQARRDADAAATAALGLREHAQALAARADACDPATAAERPAGRLADVLDSCVTEYRAVAEAADRAIGAGLVCESAYQSLSVTR
jgi:hypothetical protein